MFFFCVYYSIIFWNGMISKNTAMKELGKQNLVISAVRKAFHTFLWHVSTFGREKLSMKSEF